MASAGLDVKCGNVTHSNPFNKTSTSCRRFALESAMKMQRLKRSKEMEQLQRDSRRSKDIPSQERLRHGVTLTLWQYAIGPAIISCLDSIRIFRWSRKIAQDSLRKFRLHDALYQLPILVWCKEENISRFLALYQCHIAQQSGVEKQNSR